MDYPAFLHGLHTHIQTSPYLDNAERQTLLHLTADNIEEFLQRLQAIVNDMATQQGIPPDEAITTLADIFPSLGYLWNVLASQPDDTDQAEDL